MNNPLALHQTYALAARRNLMKSIVYLAELFSQEFLHIWSFPSVHDMNFTKILEKRGNLNLR